MNGNEAGIVAREGTMIVNNVVNGNVALCVGIRLGALSTQIHVDA